MKKSYPSAPNHLVCFSSHDFVIHDFVNILFSLFRSRFTLSTLNQSIRLRFQILERYALHVQTRLEALVYVFLHSPSPIRVYLRSLAVNYLAAGLNEVAGKIRRFAHGAILKETKCIKQ